jgi:predicted DCC family thiol-disulfide oxidoreductase YuxK
MLLVYGLTYGLLFDLGLWGWTFVAAALLVTSTETWDAYQGRFRKGRALTVIYDADCGICLWLARLLERMDLRRQITFQGNDLLATPPEPAADAQGQPYRAPAEGEEPARVLYRRLKPGAPIETAPLPAAITDDLVTGTVVAVDEGGRVLTEGRAVAAIVRSLPFGAVLSLPLRIPGITSLFDVLYRLIPPRRFAISEALGMGACGLTPPPKTSAGDESALPEVPPAVRLRRLFTGAAREIAAVALLAAVLAQTARENPWPAALTPPQPRVFAAITGWPRLVSRYDLFAPEPPKEDGVLIVDAQTRSGRAIDPMTGAEPQFQSTRFRLGPLWAAYLERVRKKDAGDFQRAFRDYLVKGGDTWSTDLSENQITGLDAYWLVYRSPAPGGRAAELVGREKLFSHSRGGRGRTEVPVLEPTPNR